MQNEPTTDRGLDQTQASLTVKPSENAIDSLCTAVEFARRQDDYKWKWIALAAHHALYSFCIAAIHSSDPARTREGGTRDRNWYWKRGNEINWSKSKMLKVGKDPAYRIVWEQTDEEPPLPAQRRRDDPSDTKVIGFWSALARIQDDRWMGATVFSKPVAISDKEISGLSWLTIHVRNELLHHSPKFLSIEVESIRETCLIAFKVIESLVLESHTLTLQNDQYERIQKALVELRHLLETPR